METTTPIKQAETVAPNEQRTIIQIGMLESIIGILVFVFSIGVAWGVVKTKLTAISDDIKNNITPSLKDVRERLVGVETKVNALWKDRIAPQHSPRQLNEVGKIILNESGIKEIVDKKRDELLKIVKERNPDNPYDAEQFILSAMQELPKHCPDMIGDLKKGAFKTGADIESVLFVGAIYLRNLIFPELGFSLGDLDKPKE